MQERDINLLSVTDAAGILGISETRMRNIADAHALPVTRTNRGIRLFKRADVERLRRQREAKAAGRKVA